jgi:beta-catenin-like protein 1
MNSRLKRRKEIQNIEKFVESTENITTTDEIEKKTLMEKLNKDESETSVEITRQSVKKMCLSLEKKIQENQIKRLKFADSPDKFMDSEFDLDEEINQLKKLTDTPQFLNVLTTTGTIRTIFSLLEHENIDIVLNVIDLLKEYTDSDTVFADQTGIIFVENLVFFFFFLVF